MRTLVVHTGGIGDLVLACPAIKTLGDAASITLAGDVSRLRLAVDGGVAGEAVSLDSLDFHTVFSTPSKKLLTALAVFERVVVWMKDGDGTIAGVIRGCGVGDVRCFAGVPPEDWVGHASAYFLDCLGEAGVNNFRLGLSPTSGPDILMQPGSGSMKKNWPLNNFEALSEALIAQGHGVGWCVGPAEESIAVPEGVEEFREVDLVTVGGMLAGAQCFVGNDSGLGHVAATVGCPVVSMFGPTDPAVWAPWGAQVVRGHRDEWPAVDAVQVAVDRLRRGGRIIYNAGSHYETQAEWQGM